MSVTTRLTAPPTRDMATEPAAGARLWRTGALAGAGASLATFAVAGLARALHVSLRVGGKAIPVAGFPQLTFVAAIVGTLLAVVLSHRAAQPRRSFVITTVALMVLSIVPDAIVNAQATTKGTLALTHVIAAAIVIPVLASRLSD